MNIEQLQPEWIVTDMGLTFFHPRTPQRKGEAMTTRHNILADKVQDDTDDEIPTCVCGFSAAAIDWDCMGADGDDLFCPACNVVFIR